MTDPHGMAMLAFLEGDDSPFHYVRDDGFAAPMRIGRRFGSFDDFSAVEKDACALVAGRVLDLGCGSGKHVAGLRSQGFSCIGVDNSAVVMEVCRRQGIGGVARMDAFRLGFAAGAFDSVTLFANGISMGGTDAGVRDLLAECARVTGPGGRVIVTNVDVRGSPHEHDRAYHRANLAAGRRPGQLVLRSRFRGVDGPPFRWLLLSPDELAEVIAGTGWALGEVIRQPGGTYCASLSKGSQ